QLLQEELVHSERLASIGRLAAGVAHEIGNPLTGIDCLAQNLLAEGDEATTRESAKQILNQTLRISNIVQTLVNFAHAGVNSHGALEPLDVFQCAEEAIYLLGLDRNARLVNFRNLCAREITAVADGQRLLQVLLNLLSNARDAVESGGEIAVENHRELNRTVITVTDNGCGIPRAHLDQVLEPFFTTKAPGEGTGLGLALVYSIVRDMDGSMEIESPLEISTGRGVRVSISLPSR
ncbi:MAG: ATP-binding protein, partial [Pseudomonadales bacterium]